MTGKIRLCDDHTLLSCLLPQISLNLTLSCKNPSIFYVEGVGENTKFYTVFLRLSKLRALILIVEVTER